ncbi:excinuclease ABC subunit UvrC [Fimbriiglobus ruber]|uniref:Excinuclease ABC subunit C n=1 Tax=Fimbriiglobus ruber TaxID=1908690 RepID=A0A225DHY5_9BACT|nr:excinuclease ABC subunit UvrC [Fimbriiglobus ruber]OWK41081.1 Excinuclease ABC subunit C [Fimbriiglobus ruber]
MSDESTPVSFQTPDPSKIPPGEKVKEFPAAPGVYLMKDDAGNVIYVGKAKSLRSRASHYFTKEAAENTRTAELVKCIRDIDFIPCETEVEALLKEARLVKDIQPRFNVLLKDDKTFPYLQIRTREEFPRVEFTRSPRRKGVRLYGPFTNARSLRAAIQVLQRVFQFRTCTLDIKSDDDRWRWFRPCILHSIRQCSAPCNLRVTREEYRRQIRKLILILEGKKGKLLKEMEGHMKEASVALQFEKAARLRDEIAALKRLELRGDVEANVQPEVFPIDPKKGLVGLRKVLGLAKVPRTIEGVDIAHLGGSDTVASLVAFLDGLPFKPGYRRFKIKSVEGVDDFASMREIVTRRFKRLHDDDSVFPDILLIDGGKGQLNAALDAFKMLAIDPPCVISLAKQEEEIFRPGQSESIKLSRHSAALRLLQYVRDEAHRFAQHYHHILRRKKLTGE